jgi:hypothetical protein
VEDVLGWNDSQGRTVEVVSISRTFPHPGQPTNAIAGSYQDFPAAYPTLRTWSFGFLYTGELRVRFIIDGSSDYYDLPTGGDQLRNFICYRTGVNVQVFLEPTPGGVTPILAQSWIDRHIDNITSNRKLSRVSSWLYNLTHKVEDDNRETCLTKDWKVNRKNLPIYNPYTPLQNQTTRLAGASSRSEDEIGVFHGNADSASSFRFAGSTTPEVVGKALAGESIMSFRELLKMPSLVQYISVPGDAAGSHIRVRVPIYELLKNGDEDNHLYSYLRSSFAVCKGGMVFHIHILGEGSVSAAIVNNNDTIAQPISTAIADSKVNPYLAFKVPYQRTTPFVYHEVDKAGDLDFILDLRAHTEAAVTFMLYRQSAEDFSFCAYNGPANISHDI